MDVQPLVVEKPQRKGAVRAPRFPRARNRSAILVGFFAFAVSLAGSWIPSYWFDEVATLQVARLSWGDLFAFTGRIDAVHATYYSVIKVWIGVFGESELATRALSALAIGVAAAGLVVLVNLLTSLHVGVIAGVIFAILPHTTFIGAEARSYALSAAIAVWATVVFLLAIRSADRRWWPVYAAVVAVGSYVFLYSILLLAAHGVYLLRLHRVRRILIPWLLSAVAVAVAALPVVLFGLKQKAQINWIAYQPELGLWANLTEPAFQKSDDVAMFAWFAALVLALCFAWRMSETRRRLLWLAFTWFLAPLVILLAADAAIGSVFVPRYLSFAVPAVAVLLGLAFTLSPRKQVAWGLVACLALVSLPGYVAQRAPFAKNDGSDLGQIATFIQENAAPGDGVYLQQGGWSNKVPRMALYGYPAAFESTRDVAFRSSFKTTGGFSDITRDLAWIGDGLDGVDRLWVVTVGSPEAQEAVASGMILESRGFTARGATETNESTIILYER